jgi:outer membrane protein assembly factor BamB
MSAETVSRCHRVLTFSVLWALVCSTLAGAEGPATAGGGLDWPQWGGPGRDFTVEARSLADRWPEGGPRVLWRRPLGVGHSSIVRVGDRLYTMFRPLPSPGAAEGEHVAEERVIALDASTGKTLWEHVYPSVPLNFRFGAGPHSTPLVMEGTVFAMSTNKVLFALDALTGKVRWSHDLVAEYGAPPTLIRPAVKAGYGPSPLAYGANVIVPAGGDGQALMSFRRGDGALVWKAGDYLIAPSSPIRIELDGREQLVHFGGEKIVGVDPATGVMLWSHPHDTRGDMNNSTPVFIPSRQLLLVSSAYDVGTRMIKLVSQAGAVGTEEQWFQKRLEVMFGNVVRLGDMAIGSSGNFGPAFLMAVDVETGEVLWQERGFGKASFVLVGEQLIILDEEGVLALAAPTREGLGLKARADVLASTSWTAPTLVGTTLYLRDRLEIVALDLGD